MHSRIAATVAIVTGAIALFATLAFARASAPQARHRRTGLWVGNYDFLSEFKGAALRRGGARHAGIAIGNPNLLDPAELAFDPEGDLWVAYSVPTSEGALIVELTHRDIARIKSGRRTKVKIILGAPGSNGGSFTEPSGLAIDSAGDLWVSDFFEQSIMEFLPSQIAEGGSPTPSVYISGVNFGPGVMRFDGAGNLWVAATPVKLGDSSRVCRFSPADRGESGPPNPSLVLDVSAALQVAGLAFDGSGNLWVAVGGPEVEMLMYPQSDLAATGEIAPSPAVALAALQYNCGGLNCVGGIDFDGSGDLWVSLRPNQQIIEFSNPQSSSGPTVQPAIVITQNRRRTNFNLPGPIRFAPATRKKLRRN